MFKLFKLLIITLTLFQLGNNSNAQTVGDVMPYYDASSSNFYIYYLRDVWNDATNQRHPWNALTTTDFNNYADTGEKLSCSSEACKQDFAIGTGSVIKEGSTYYAFYTGHNPNPAAGSCVTTKEGVMLATSTGANTAFTKMTSFTTIYAPSGYDLADNFRDPYVFKDGNTFYMLVAARTAVNGTWRGVVAKYTSTNLTSWSYAGILYDGGSFNYFMMECPQIFKIGSTYYLTFSYTDTKNVYYCKSSSANGPWSNPVGTNILSGVGYSARTASNGTATYIWGWQVNGTTWAGQLLSHQLLQDSNGDLVVTSISSGNIPVTGVSVSPTTGTIKVGATQQLTASVAPTNATNKLVTWSSNNTSIASVNASGLVTGVATGSANITVTTIDGGKTATCTVTVINATVPVLGISVSPTATINVGTTQQLTATVAPSNATNKTVTWSSSNTSIASVNSSGLVTGVAQGTATITVTTQDGGKTATCTVTVINATVPVLGVSISPTATINVGATQQLTATVAPSNATNKTVAWISSNTSIASVNPSGLITGLSTGSVTLTVTTNDGGKTATCTVTVSPSTGIVAGTYEIVARHSGKAMDADQGGSVNGAAVQQWDYLGGGNQKWDVVPTSPTGYYTITSASGGKVLDSEGSANGAKIQLWSNLGGDNQKWQIVDLGNGYFKILSKIVSGRGIEVTVSSLNNGAQLKLADYTGGTQQQWDFVLLALKSATVIESVADAKASGNLVVYPVPASDIFTIDLTPFNEDKDVNIMITDVFGKRITNVKATEVKYSISSKSLGMHSGIYFITVKSENRSSVVKMIIE